MIDFIFTLDYEIYGDGTGSLKDLVYEPTEVLRGIFRKWDAPFVNYVEVAEFERIDACGTDPAIELVKKQIRDLHHEGSEIALHLHPQWCNARHEQGRWLLDSAEYNLCTLPRTRIAQIVERSLTYLRDVVGQADFTPVSFRAGNWLFQPTPTAASVLAEHGLKVDSSVFKGGVLHNHDLDYRNSLKNGYYWTFDSDVSRANAQGTWIEVPIYTEMVRPWKMRTSKRMGFSNGHVAVGQTAGQKLNRARDMMRLRYPLKLDFCRMTLGELVSMTERVMREDQGHPSAYKPIVSIGHSKDLIDPQTIDDFLGFLREKKIPVTTFERILPTLQKALAAAPAAEMDSRLSHSQQAR